MMGPASLEVILYVGAIGLSVIGMAGVVLSNHLLRMVLALALAECGANLLLVLAGFRPGAQAPILLGGGSAGPMVDPVPQAMVLTAIVIGVGVQALAVALLIRVQRAYGTLDMRELKRRFEQDMAAAAGIEVSGSLDGPAGGRPLPPVVVGAEELHP
jgi:multisubunit Na+/H+ antiporter MnhC subunit